MKNPNTEIESYLRLKQVLEIIPVSKSTWYRGIKSGIYPRPVKLSTRVSAWKYSEIATIPQNHA